MVETIWKCSGASVRGNSHEIAGTECQDAWAMFSANRCSNTSPARQYSRAEGIVYRKGRAYRITKHSAKAKHRRTGSFLKRNGGFQSSSFIALATHAVATAVCVCDGAGSVEHSRTGAALTSKIVTEQLAMFFDETFKNPKKVFLTVLKIVLKELCEAAKKLQCPLRELACTLVAVAVDNAGRWVYWHLGDGGIIARFDNDLRVLSTPQKGEYANETYFVTERDAAEHLQFGVSTEETQNVTGFAVFSDGLEMMLYDHVTLDVSSAIAGMLNWHAKNNEETVSQAIKTNITKVFRQKTNDDCSLVLLTRQN
ncbi:MAG: protein phosphatase 2C domain-containing protein [Planctomycetaceae bacterium]|jgi:serine/threonine protein phosphatase PrpC|nr:protein phosphatase 2C domain-containing protein [Planctomycetaceae bacterium]